MQHTGKTHQLLLLRLVLVGFACSAVLTFAAQALLPPSKPWLSQKGVGSETEATEYYAAIQAPATLSDWKASYGFNDVDETRAVYFNNADLGFGRDMHCRKWSAVDVACYVVNHGFGPDSPARLSVNAAIDNKHTLATVAMVYTNADARVSFYVYGPDESLLNKVALDSEGNKYVPHLCLSCHGGTYNDTTNAVSGANFLPFDLASFQYSVRAGYSRADQEEAFRQLNAMVRDTLPLSRTIELIDGWYAATGGVYQPGSVQDNTFVAPDYNASESDRDLYNNVVKPYCRTCHIAQGFDLGTPAAVSVARNAVFNGHYMPHSEKTARLFWDSPAPALLAKNRGWSIRVTRLDDPPPQPEFCAQGDCSLREAIIIANSNTSSNTSIITFDVDGTFTLAQSGFGEDQARTGDLDIRKDVFILGNGAGKTVIDSGGIDRVFDIAGRIKVVIQGVTIQGGIAWDGGGGGILFSGGDTDLTLNASVVKGNSAIYGGGIAVRTPRVFEELYIAPIVGINNSTIGPNNHATGTCERYPEGFGGGIFNYGDGVMTLTSSTVSGNTSLCTGGGIFNESSITVNHTTIVLNNGSDGTGGLASSKGSMQNSIIAGNRNRNGESDCGTIPDHFSSKGYNLVGQNGNRNGCPTIGTDLVLAGDLNTAINTSLEGDVPYHALVTGSQASDAIPLDSGNCSPPSYDQRNVARPLDGNTDSARIPACDIGAYEVNKPPRPNLLKNASFELDANGDNRPDNWAGNRKFTRSSVLSPVTGAFVGQFHATNDTSATVQQKVGVRAEKYYRATAWVQIPATSDAFHFTFQVDWLDSSGTVIGTAISASFLDDTNGSWTRVGGDLPGHRLKQ